MIKLNKDGLNIPSVTTESITMGDTEVSSFNQFVSKNENGEIEETLYLKGHIKPTIDREQQFIDFGYDYDSRTGALIALRGVDYEAAPGSFVLVARDAEHNFTLQGNIDGTLTWGSYNVVTYSLLNKLDSNIYFTTDNSRTGATIGFNGSANGARCTLYSKNHTSYPGYFQLTAGNSSSSVSLTGKPDGTLTWNNQSIVTNYNKTHIYFDHTAATSRDIGFSTSNNNTKRGAYMTFKAGGDTSAPGYFSIVARDETNATTLQGRPGGTLAWGGSTIYTAGNLTGGVSTIATSNLTASRALISNSSGKVAVSAVTSTELGYLDGVTSNVQTQLNSKIDLVPGAIIAMAADRAPGSGWLICQGQEVSRTTYATLWNAIGTKYGAGDGSTTFNVPSLINRVIMGTWSSTFGTTVESGLPNITGTIQTRSSNGSSYGVLVDGSGPFSKGGIQTGSGTGGVLTVSSTSKNADIISFNASKSNSIYGKSTIVQPPALLIRYYIKY